ncbi:hypothetical protein ABFT80_13990 [Mesorhizobium sp. SB112]|uniref:hypothetical protein n=1 Tax=Mesorhizobium sp. SB112 TaxID=3151853 RepID=UPI003265E6FE
MPNFDVSSQKVHVRPVHQSELPPLRRMGRGPNLDYMTYASGPRQMGARNARAGARGSALQMVMSAANENSLAVWLKGWLRNNETSIVQQMEAKGHSTFVLQVNYQVSDSFENRVFESRDIYLLGTVPTQNDVGTILTEERLYGPQMDVTPRTKLTKLQYAYLVGRKL